MDRHVRRRNEHLRDKLNTSNSNCGGLHGDHSMNEHGRGMAAEITKQSTEIVVIVPAPNWPCEFEKSKTIGSKSLFRRLMHWGPIIAIIVILMIGSCAVYLHVKWWPIRNPLSMINFLIFLFFNYSTLNYLLRSSYTGPGYLPMSWYPPIQIPEGSLQFCIVCNGYKVPRSHHCSQCQRCVLKMDHHCPWINNCVGHANHSYFIRFLLSSVFGCIHAILIIVSSLYYALHRPWYLENGGISVENIVLPINSFIFAFFALGISLAVVVAVGLLLILQLRGIYRNRTSIEDYIVDKATSRTRLKPFLYPYDLGPLRNFQEVLGSFNGGVKGNGVWWPVLSHSDQFSFSREQLTQKRLKRENTLEIAVKRDYNGGFCELAKFGCKTCIHQPCTDGKRVVVEEGERWMITRACEHWLYGAEKELNRYIEGNHALGADIVRKLNYKRGWFPRKCV